MSEWSTQGDINYLSVKNNQLHVKETVGKYLILIRIVPTDTSDILTDKGDILSQMMNNIYIVYSFS